MDRRFSVLVYEKSEINANMTLGLNTRTGCQRNQKTIIKIIQEGDRTRVTLSFIGDFLSSQ